MSQFEKYYEEFLDMRTHLEELMIRHGGEHALRVLKIMEFDGISAAMRGCETLVDGLGDRSIYNPKLPQVAVRLAEMMSDELLTNVKDPLLLAAQLVEASRRRIKWQALTLEQRDLASRWADLSDLVAQNDAELTCRLPDATLPRPMGFFFFLCETRGEVEWYKECRLH